MMDGTIKKVMEHRQKAEDLPGKGRSFCEGRKDGSYCYCRNLISVCIVLDETVFKPKRKNHGLKNQVRFQRRATGMAVIFYLMKRRCFLQKRNMVSGSA